MIATHLDQTTYKRRSINEQPGFCNLPGIALARTPGTANPATSR
jgi:hypothetical protein